MMTFEAFQKWADEEFLKRNGGFFPKFPKIWFAEVEKSHDGIRKLIGGNLVQKFYKLNSQQKALTEKECGSIIDTIIKILPDYLKSYQFERDVFFLPTIPRGTHNAIRLTKHIKTFADQRARYGDLSPDKLKELDKLLSDLGELWSKARTTEVDLEITLSTTPKGFALLGHYTPDKDSCFRQDSDKPYHKYILAQSENTFVITISKRDKKKNKNVNVARCFGFMTDDMKTAALANYYYSPKFPEGDALEVIKMLFEEIWQDKTEFHENLVLFNKDLVYQNPYGNWCLTKGAGSRPKKTSIEFNIDNIRRFRCVKCKRQYTHDGDINVVDDDIVCYNCIHKANVCELSGERTFKKLDTLIKDGHVYSVHPRYAAEYKRCSNCECLHDTDGLVEQDNTICSDCVEILYSECPSCETMIKDSDFIDLGDEEVCQDCFNNKKIKPNLDIYFNILELMEETEVVS